MISLIAATCTVAQSVAFVQPTSSDAYRKYFLGDWKLRKKLIYTSGGLSGTFDGNATFRPLDVRAPRLISYVETGMYTPDNEMFGGARHVWNSTPRTLRHTRDTRAVGRAA